MASSNPTFLKTLHDGLTVRNVDTLKKFLKLLPISDKPTRKAELVDTLNTYLLGPGLEKLWQELDTLQQAAVAEAVHITGGEYNREQFHAKYGGYPQWGDRSSYSYNQPAAKLDLFFYPTANYSSIVVMPQELQEKLKAFVPEPKSLTLKSYDDPPQTLEVKRYSYDWDTRQSIKSVEDVPVVCCSSEQLAQQELLAVLRLIHLGKVSVSDKTLMPGKAAMKAIMPLLQGGDYYSETNEPDDNYHDPIGMIKPFAWVMLLQAGGLASLDGKKLQLTKAGQKAMGGAPAKTIQAIWKKWLKTTILDELRRVDNIKG